MTAAALAWMEACVLAAASQLVPPAGPADADPVQDSQSVHKNSRDNEHKKRAVQSGARSLLERRE